MYSSPRAASREIWTRCDHVSGPIPAQPHSKDKTYYLHRKTNRLIWWWLLAVQPRLWYLYLRLILCSTITQLGLQMYDSGTWWWFQVCRTKHGQWSINAEKICKARHRIRRNQTFPIWEETLIQFSSLYLGMLWTHNFLKLEIYHQYLCNEDADRVFHFQHIRTQGTDCWWCSTWLSVPAGAFKCNQVNYIIHWTCKCNLYYEIP